MEDLTNETGKGLKRGKVRLNEKADWRIEAVNIDSGYSDTVRRISSIRVYTKVDFDMVVSHSFIATASVENKAELAAWMNEAERNGFDAAGFNVLLGIIKAEINPHGTLIWAI